MKTIQIEVKKESLENHYLLRAAGVRRVHVGWYTVSYNGAKLDNSTVCSAKRNKNGQIKH